MEEALKRILQRALDGKVALVLGSGASVGSTLPKGRKILLGDDLKNLLSDQFLSGNYKDNDLKFVSDMAISESSLFDVQDFIAEHFQGIMPANFQLKIPDYKWRAIFTTNYDRLIEVCYEQNTSKVQTPEIILTNDDRFDQTRINNTLVPLVKLHGCVTRTRDQDLPLVLTVEQYNDSLEQNRDRLFNFLFEVAYENTLVFVGHSLQDHNLRTVMSKTQKESKHGQRHYLLKPGIEDIEVRFWAQHKITALNITFEDLIDYLDKNTTDSLRGLSAARPNTIHVIQQKFTSKTPPSDELIKFLDSSVEYISDGINISAHDPKDFYKGVDQGWFPLVEDLPIKRSLEDKIYESVVSQLDLDKNLNTELVVVKAEAGSGKTVLLRQIAWRGRTQHDGVFLWVKENSSMDISLIEEICLKTNERVFIIWDDAGNNFLEILKFVSGSRSKKLKVTVITAERYNEWNMRCDGLEQYLTDVFTLGYLSENEIDELLVKLEVHNSLGPNLVSKNLDERRSELKSIHGRQLLVALYEATMGVSFEEIVYDEYHNLEPLLAKKIYLTVCTLNRLRVPVRAGLISRIYEITFEDFSSQFYKPLEKVVFTRDSVNTDINYSSRHPEVAEIVFRRVLNTPELRYREYIQILSKLNISFSSDHTSFRQLIKAKSLVELFPSYEDIRSIYEYSIKVFGKDAYLLQQMANYERIRPNGSLERACEILADALESSPNDRSILHSFSTVWRDRANVEKNLTSKASYRRKSRAYLELSLQRFGSSSYIKTAFIELALNDLEDLLSDSSETQKVIDDAVTQVQLKISENKQTYPQEAYTHSLEAKLSKLLNDDEAAQKALEKSFEANDRDPYLAIRLASIYENKNDKEKALTVIQDALERRGTDHKLNFHLAELMKSESNYDAARLIYHYRRSFTPGDTNYIAQFWFARFAYESENHKFTQEASDVFETLRSARVSFNQRTEIRDYSVTNSLNTTFTGTIVRKRMNFGFIRVDGSGKEIFCPQNNMLENLWEVAAESDRVKLNIGYSFNGPVCCNVEPE